MNEFDKTNKHFKHKNNLRGIIFVGAFSRSKFSRGTKKPGIVIPYTLSQADWFVHSEIQNQY